MSFSDFTPNTVYAGEAVRGILASYFKLWNLPYLPKRNPCAQPVSLERAHFPLLLQHDYVAAEKSDGVRYTLYLCREGGQNYSMLIDRKLTLYQIPVAGARKLFNGTIFDGELVWTNCNGVRAQSYLIFDVIAFKGSTAIQRANLHERLAVIRQAIDLDGTAVQSPETAAALARKGKIICGGNAHGLSFRAKPCLPLSQLDTLLRQLSTISHGSDGLIFTPVNQPVMAGTAEQIFKLKAKHTIDLELRDGQLLLGIGGSSDTAPRRVTLNTLGIAFDVDDQLRAQLEQGVASIIECEVTLQDAGAQLRFVGHRTDKSHPNTVRTVLATLTNLREDIKPEELCSGLRRDWSAGRSQPTPLRGRLTGAELANIALGDAIDQSFWQENGQLGTDA